MEVLLKADLPLPLFIRGKVRDTYKLGDHLLIVATDRISVFDVVLPDGIPDKGLVLNQLSAYWFNETRGLVTNHVIEVVEDVGCLDAYLPEKDRFPYPAYLAGRSMVVRKVKLIPVECVVRGYLAGSGWVEYQKSGSVCGISLPEGLRESEELLEPIFTPTTKAEPPEHDEPMSMDDVKDQLGEALAEKLKDSCISIYSFARERARDRGIIIADTKFEFGLDNGELILIDELLTPDSSRFWPANQYQVGWSQPSYDKQPVRDWTEATGWDKSPPAPMLTQEVIESTTQRYREAYERLTGRKLKEY
ncbi:MAG: phosphoribosylaminoimidazolesuccinocarboxamide synthase [Dehalococcoidales bacterium]|nr:MAG: phosphoribosylaminoimidazolesuccinocarboxamide synthase [Dehalococcoidales bacterium]